MFSGIVECACPVRAAEDVGGTRRLVLDLSPLRAAGAPREPASGRAGVSGVVGAVGPGASGRTDADPVVRLGASVAVDGVCLTVAALHGDEVAFDVVSETLARTGLGDVRAGDRVNVERSLRYGDPVDGHIVSGHVEATGEVLALDETPGDVRLSVRCGPAFAALLLPKGSVAIDGVSLTIATLAEDAFGVALVPHTLQRTTLGVLRPGDRVNLEPDLLGRWVLEAVRRARG